MTAVKERPLFKKREGRTVGQWRVLWAREGTAECGRHSVPAGSGEGGRGRGLEAALGGFPADALPGASGAQAESRAGRVRRGQSGCGEGADRAGHRTAASKPRASQDPVPAQHRACALLVPMGHPDKA